MQGTHYVRRILHPKKYVSLQVLCDYAGIKTDNFSDSVKEALDKKVWQMCVPGYPAPFHGVWYVRNEEAAEYAMSKSPIALISKKQFSDYPCIVVDNPMGLYAKMSQYYRKLHKKLRATVVTGSIGKTTTSEMLAVVYSKYAKTDYSWDNDNIPDAVSYNVQHLSTSHRMMVQEICESYIHTAQWGSLIAYPTAAVITTIDYSHFERFDSVDAIAAEVCTVVRGLQPKAPVIVTKGEFVWYDKLEGHPAVTVSDSDNSADYYAKNIRVTSSGLSFVVVDNMKHTEHNVSLVNVYARHNIIAALKVFAVSCCDGIPYDKIITGLENYRTRGIRQNVIWTSSKVCLYVDCFNAIASSVRSAIEAAGQIPVAGRRIAVLGDVEECGEQSFAQHDESVSAVNESNFDVLITFGEKISAALSRSENRVTLSSMPCHDMTEVETYLRNHVSSGDLVLFKASHSGRLSEIVKRVWPETEVMLQFDSAKKLRLRKILKSCR